MDDLLDEPARARPPAGPASAAYACLLLALAAGLCPRAAVSLFLAAYAVGMLPSPVQRQPTGMAGWVESAIAVTLSAALAGPVETAGSVLTMLAVQLLDDAWDLERDRNEARPNMAQAVGRGPAVLLAVGVYGVAAWLDPAKALAAGVAAAGILTGLCPLPPAGGDGGVPVGAADAAAGGKDGRRAGAVARGEAVFRLAALGVASATAAAVARLVRHFRLVAAPAAESAAGGLPAGPGTGPGDLAVLPPWAGWAVLAAVCLLAAVAVAGLVMAYRRGRREGAEREKRAAAALAALQRLADRLDSARGPGPGTGETDHRRS